MSRIHPVEIVCSQKKQEIKSFQIVAELIADASVYAQTNNTHIENISDFSDDYDDTPPKCVDAISAIKEGVVTLTFIDSNECAAVMRVVEDAFGRCRWESDSANHKGTFYPTRSWNGTACE